MKSTGAPTAQLIEQTLDVWQPRSRRQLSREDTRQMAENIVGFFQILNEWALDEAISPSAGYPISRRSSGGCTDHETFADDWPKGEVASHR